MSTHRIQQQGQADFVAPAAQHRTFTLRPLAFAVHLAIAGSVALAGWAPEAQAQNAGNQAAAPARSYHIPAGPLAASLNRFAEEAGVLLTASGEVTQGKTSPGLQGSHSVQSGFAALLAGTGLEAFR